MQQDNKWTLSFNYIVHLDAVYLCELMVEARGIVYGQFIRCSDI